MQTPPRNMTAPDTAPGSRLQAWLIKELGLPEDATEEDAPETFGDALKEWLAKTAKPDPKKLVPVEAVTEILRDRSGERLALAHA